MTSNGETIEGWQNPQLMQPVRPTAKKIKTKKKGNSIRPSRLAESRAYEGWLDEQWRKHHNLDIDRNVLAKNNAKNRLNARSERIRLFRRHYKSNTADTKQTTRLPTSLLNQYYKYKNSTASNKNKLNAKEYKDNSATPLSDHELYHNSILSYHQAQQKQDEPNLNFNIDIISTKDLENHTWLKPEHVSALEKYAIQSPRNNDDRNDDTNNYNNNEVDGSRKNMQHDADGADRYMKKTNFEERLTKEPDSVEFNKYKNSILSMSKQVTTTYKNALENIITYI